MLALQRGTLDLITSLEAEVPGADERVPFVDLLEAAAEGVGEDEAACARRQLVCRQSGKRGLTDRVAESVCAVRVEFSSVVVYRTRSCKRCSTPEFVDPVRTGRDIQLGQVTGTAQPAQTPSASSRFHPPHKHSLDIRRRLDKVRTGDRTSRDETGPVPGLQTPGDDDSFSVAEGGVAVRRGRLGRGAAGRVSE
jgi:hypothetical protein